MIFLSRVDPDPVFFSTRIRFFLEVRIRIRVNPSRIHNPALNFRTSDYIKLFRYILYFQEVLTNFTQ